MMSHKAFSLAAGAVFFIIAVLHVLRVIYGWEAVLNGSILPMWISWVAALLSGYLAFQGLRLSRRSP